MRTPAIHARDNCSIGDKTGDRRDCAGNKPLHAEHTLHVTNLPNDLRGKRAEDEAVVRSCGHA